MHIQKVALAAGLALTVTASPVLAVEFTGGEVGLGYGFFTDDDDFNRLALEGAVELGFTRNIGVQVDLASYSFGAIDENGTNVTLHALYHASNLFSAGAFYAYDELYSESLDTYGFEAGYEAPMVDLEGYIIFGEEEGVSGDGFGLSARYKAGDALSIGVSYDYIDVENMMSIDRLAAKVSYEATPGLEVYAELGTGGVDVDGYLSDSENFAGFGVTYAFGAERGATMGKRGLLHLIPGL